MVDADGAPRLDTRVLSKIPIAAGPRHSRVSLSGSSYSRLRWVCWILRTRRICHWSKHCERRCRSRTFLRRGERSEKMYYILALTTTDHAQVIVQQVEPGHGYEAYRRLVEAYDPSDIDARLVDARGYFVGQVHVEALFGTAAGLEVARHAVRAKDGPRSG